MYDVSEIRTTLTPVQAVPSAKGFPLLGQTLMALSGPLEFLKDLKNNYPDVVKIKIGTKTYYVIQTPEASRHVLQENARNYFKPGAAKMMKRFLGNGLATSNGELWLKQRRLIQPAFHKKKIDGLIKTITEETDLLIKKWKTLPDNTIVDINQEMLKLTLRNITRTMFGTELNENVDDIAIVINKLLSTASSSVTSLIKFPEWFPTPSNIRFRRANKAFEKIIYQFIADRKNENRDSAADLLDMLLFAHDSHDQSEMNVQQLRDEITTIFMAGHETTAQTLSWVLYQQALHKKPFTRSAIEETMRLYPPVWIMARKSIEADNVNGYHIPAQSTVLVNVYGMNHYKGYWDDPETFNPARFDSTERHPFLFIPFGGGQRVCIGNLFAMMVMETVVGKLEKEFEFDIPAGFKVKPEPSVTLRAKGGIKLIVKKKNRIHEL